MSTKADINSASKEESTYHVIWGGRLYSGITLKSALESAATILSKAALNLKETLTVDFD